MVAIRRLKTPGSKTKDSTNLGNSEGFSLPTRMTWISLDGCPCTVGFIKEELKEPKCFVVGNEHACNRLHSKTPSPPFKMVTTETSLKRWS